jgi:hypothetical protein
MEGIEPSGFGARTGGRDTSRSVLACKWTSAFIYPKSACSGPRRWRMDRVEAWATFLLVLVAGLVLLSFMGVVVGAWLGHEFGSILHALGTPLVAIQA